MTRQESVEKREALDRRHRWQIAGVLTGALLLGLCVYMLLDGSHKPLALPLSAVILLIGSAVSLTLMLRRSSPVDLRCPACGTSFGRKGLMATIETSKCPQCDA